MKSPLNKYRKLVGTVLTTFFTLCILISTTNPVEGTEPTNYQLQSGDLIQMNILQEPELETTGRITIKGTLQFPLIGQLEVANKDLGELQSTLFDRYDRGFLVNPQISLLITEYAERRVSIRGKVNKPGFVIIPPEEQFTILDAIAAAGDISTSGNDRKVELHQHSDTGETTVRVIDLSQVANSREFSTIYLRDNDQIVVPEKLF